MKLNYKRIILVGFAFFLIQAFWQAYDNTIPMILTNKFGMSQAWSGAIMALDNVLALFMLPLFGAISDKHHSKWGRRTPFVHAVLPRQKSAKRASIRTAREKKAFVLRDDSFCVRRKREKEAPKRGIEPG